MRFMASPYAEKAADGMDPKSGTSRLNHAEVEAIQLFTRFAAMLGQPRSVAEIYGLLFMSEKPSQWMH